MILSFPCPGGSRKDKNAGADRGAGTEGAGAVPLWTKDNTNGSGEGPQWLWPRGLPKRWMAQGAGRKWGRRIRWPEDSLPGGGPHIRGRIL